MSSALEALRRAPTDFAVTPDDIWDDHARPHVPGINDSVMKAIEGRIDAAERSRRSSVLGLPIVGEGGRGKSHSLGQARKLVQDRGGFFVRFNLLNVDDFWSNLVASYLYALNMPHRSGPTGLAFLLESLAERADVPSDLRERLLRSRLPDPGATAQFFECVRGLEPALAGTRHTLRALLLLHSKDELRAEAGDVYLNGGVIDPEAAPGFPRPAPKPPKEVVRDLSQLMSLCGATVIAVDQVDEIVRASKRDTESGERDGAGELLEMIGAGLMELRDTTRRTTVLLACLVGTWLEFRDTSQSTVLQRFEAPAHLDATLPNPEAAAELLAAVLGPVYQEAGFDPPYPSYPFGPECLREAVHFSPRRFLLAAANHLRHCVESEKVTEPDRLDTEPAPDRAPERVTPLSADLDRAFERYRDDAEVAPAITKDNEYLRVPELLSAALEAFRLEQGRGPDSFQVKSPVGPRQHFHAEVHDHQTDPKRRWVFKGIAGSHGNYVGPRVRGLYKWAALDQNNPISENHGVLWVLAPQREWGTWGPGSKVAAAVEQFARDGLVIMASDDDLRTFDALHRMRSERLPGYEEWLRRRRPASHSALLQAVFGPPGGGDGDPPDPEPTGGPTGRFIEIPLNGPGAKQSGPSDAGSAGAGSAQGRTVIDVPVAEVPEGGPPIGRRETGDEVRLDLSTTAKHIGVFAGSGSGKTVLLRRIIETCALRGVSAIVLDPNNDLSRLGRAWPDPPDTWLEGDDAAAAEYLDSVEVLIWTPGRTGGRPLTFQPLPDFAAVIDDVDEFASAVDTAVASLAPRAMVNRTTPKHAEARAVLRESLVAYARTGRSDFPGFLDFMDELPEEASSVPKAADAAAKVAATLRAVMINDRVFAGGGEALDPGVLLRPEGGKRARVSVINFLGLPTEEQRQGFVNQLELALFSWAKRNPAVDKPLSGLFVLDEAQTLAPSSGSTVCLDSTLALVSQARKYGLGMVFATQAPKGIHNRIVGNCATHWYGRINAPSQIAAAAEIAAQKGASEVDLAHLSAGQFYLVADRGATERVDVPMCLSHHPPTAPTAEEVLAAARGDE
ncbi:DUF87 domain-containing protein [Glycomyces halotolerans]